MPNINLLPWRESRREVRKRKFYVILVVAVLLALLLMMLLYFSISKQVDAQVKVNKFFEQEIAVLDVKISEISKIKEVKEDLILRMGLIQGLQATRPLVVRFLDELVRLIPDGVFVTEIEKSGTGITLKGKASSNTRVSQLMRNIETSKWLEHPSLTEIKNETNGGSGIRDFAVLMEQEIPNPLNNNESEEYGS